MREIKFRGKCKDDGTWVFGSYVRTALGLNYILPQNVLGNSSIQWLVNGKTVGQYTGSKDANGVGIFEGDILQSIDDETYLSVVEYCTDGVGSCGCCYDEFEGAGFKAKDLRFKESVVVGNIYENLELLGDSK